VTESTVTLDSIGTGRVTLDDIFVIDATEDTFAAEDWPESIEPEESADFTVTFAPLTAGWHRGTLVVDSDAVDGPVAIELRAYAAAAELGLWPTQLDFGPVATGDQREQVVYAYNDGELPVSIDALILDGSFSTDSEPAVLDAGAELAITVTFAPTAEAPEATTLEVSFGDVGSVSAALTGNDCTVGDPNEYDRDADGFSSCAGDCDDEDASVRHGAAEVANSVDDNCDGTIDEGTVAYDDDGDGYSEDDGDCDDGNASNSPDATESADWVDNDCDGVVDEGTVAYDDDGDGYTENGGDCDDSDADVSPADREVVGDGVDNDCDGTAS
jgi:hypothetical protein